MRYFTLRKAFPNPRAYLLPRIFNKEEKLFPAEDLRTENWQQGGTYEFAKVEKIACRAGGAGRRRCVSGNGRRSADVGTQRRQRRHGRRPRRGVERQEPRPQDQSHLYPAYRDGAEDRPGDRQRRSPRPDGHGPDLRPAVRGGRTTRRHHRQDQGLAGTEDREPRPYGGVHLRGEALRRAALRRRLGAVLQQGSVPQGRPRSGEAADEPGGNPGSMPTRSPRSAAT